MTLRYLHMYRHTLKGVGCAAECATHRHRLVNIPRNGNWDKIEPAYIAVRRVERDPACTRNINLCPSMGRSPATVAHRYGLTTVVKISRYNPPPKAEAADGLDKKDCKVSTGSSAEIQRQRWRLCTFVAPDLVANPLRYTGAEIFKKRQGIG